MTLVVQSSNTLKAASAVPFRPRMVLFRTGQWLFAGMTAFATTLCLIALMNTLISTEAITPPEVEARPHIDIVLNEKIIETRDPVMPEKPEAVAELPSLPPKMFEPIQAEGAIAFAAVQQVKPAFKGEPTLASGRYPIARMMISPEYPMRARQKGIEGYVDMRFDVTKTGATSNVHVVTSSPAGIFDKAAIRAVKKWKFTPFEQKGQPQPFYGMGKRLTFNLEK